MSKRRGESPRSEQQPSACGFPAPTAGVLLVALLATLGPAAGVLEARFGPELTAAVAIGDPPAETTSSDAGEAPGDGDDRVKAKDRSGLLEGLGFGVGLTLTQDFGRHDRVEEAQVVNGIVRVTKDRNVVPRLMFETHYFFESRQKFLGRFAQGRWGWGPFVAVQSGEGDVIGAVGTGLMFGFRRASGNSSFNIGFGAVVDPGVKVLGDGIEENRPLPDGETEVRFRETDQWGYLLAFSFSF